MGRVSGTAEGADGRERVTARREAIAESAGIAVEDLNLFLSGEHTLRSDVLDRLTLAVEFTKIS